MQPCHERPELRFLLLPRLQPLAAVGSPPPHSTALPRRRFTLPAAGRFGSWRRGACFFAEGWEALRGKAARRHGAGGSGGMPPFDRARRTRPPSIPTLCFPGKISVQT